LAQIIARIKTSFLYFERYKLGVKDIRDVIESKKQSGGLFTTKIRFSLLTKSIDSANRNRIRYLQQ
jgi:hypothetical protein